LWETQLEKDFR